MLQQGLEATGGIPGDDFKPLYRQMLGFYEANVSVHSRPFDGALALLDELDAITRAIESAGGLEYTARLAQREKDLAIEALGRLPESAHRQALQALAEFAVGRSY